MKGALRDVLGALASFTFAVIDLGFCLILLADLGYAWAGGPAGYAREAFAWVGARQNVELVVVALWCWGALLVFREVVLPRRAG